MNPIVVNQFKGLVTRIEEEDIRRGSAVDCLNWHFLGDHIELRRGRKLFGTEVLGSGRITGLRVARRFDGYEIPFYTYARKCLYYDQDAETSNEISSDILPVLADGEDISIEAYNSLAGNFVYISSPNSSRYKIPLANPGSVVDLLEKEYRGKIRIKNNSMFLWDRKDTFGGADRTGVYRSHIDATEAVYQFTKQEELGTGNGSNTAFSGTLAFKAANSKETCFFVVIAGAKSAATGISAITQATAAQVTSGSHGLSIGDTVVFASVSGMTQINAMIGVVLTVPDANTFTVNIDSTNFTAYGSGGTVAKAERFIDDRSGNLTGQDGGSGTINYATGAYAVTFAGGVINGEKVVAQYFREDSTRVTGSSPTDGGISNFSFSNPRDTGEGFSFRQDDGGGNFMNIESLGNQEYCLHEFKTWVLTIGSPDDAEGTSNLIYRDNVGIPYYRASKATSKGIYYVDEIGEDPAIRVLDFGRFSNEVLPQSVSEELNLNAYEFDTAVMFEWGDYIILACRTNTETINNRVFMYHKTWKSWEVHSYRVSCFDILNGALIAGDSGSSNLFKLFSGVSDEDSQIENFVILNDDKLDKEGIKVNNIMRLRGWIGVDQGIKLSYSTDNEPFVEVGGSDETVDGEVIHHPLIEGDGDYVDLSQRKIIGNTTLGEEQIGGGQDPEDAIYASPYALQFHVGTKRFERIRIKIEATGIGYASVNEYAFVDNRDKGLKLPTKYISQG